MHASYRDVAVEAARARQGRIEQLGEVGRADDDHAAARLEAAVWAGTRSGAAAIKRFSRKSRTETQASHNARWVDAILSFEQQSSTGNKSKRTRRARPAAGSASCAWRPATRAPAQQQHSNNQRQQRINTTDAMAIRSTDACTRHPGTIAQSRGRVHKSNNAGTGRQERNHVESITHRVASSTCRRPPMASISSMKMMHGDFFLAAAARTHVRMSSQSGTQLGSKFNAHSTRI